MGALVVVVVGGSLVIGSLVFLRRRATRSAEKSLDAPAFLLAWAVGFAAVDRAAR